MQPNSFSHWLLPVTGLTLLACAISGHAATGARVVVQAWNPLDPTRSENTTIMDEPTLVSDALQQTWSTVRPKLCEQFKLRMGLGGAAAGETLRDIVCTLDEAITFQVTPAGQNALRAQLALSGYVEATSTTPDVYAGIGLDSFLDPRFSVALTAKLDLSLVIQPDRNQTLRITKAKFTLNNATLDSHNVSADVIDFVIGELVPFFGGPNYKAQTEGAINAVAEDLAADFNGGLAPVNAFLKGPSQLVRVGASGADNYISVSFAPHIEPPTNGSVTGLVRWDSTKFTPRNGCQSFEVRAVVQTGPVPLYARDPTPPMRTLGVYQAEQTGAATCAFTVKGIAEGWPNVLTSRVVDPPIVKNPNTSRDRVTYSMVKEGWEGAAVPRPNLDARNYRVYANTLKMGYQTKLDAEDRTFLEREYRTNPKFDPERSPVGTVAQQGSVKAPEQRVSQRLSPQVEAVRLNPQPLPPDPEPDPAMPIQAAEAIAEPAGDPAAIIIVGGKPAYQRIKQATPAQAIDRKAATPQP